MQRPYQKTCSDDRKHTITMAKHAVTMVRHTCGDRDTKSHKITLTIPLPHHRLAYFESSAGRTPVTRHICHQMLRMVTSRDFMITSRK